MTTEAGGRYVKDLERTLREVHPTVSIVPYRFVQALRLRRSSVFHLQWIDTVFWRDDLLGVLLHAIKLAGVVTALRVRRVRVVWTAHNLIGKSHRYRRIDRFLRSVISLVADRVVLLNIEAQAPFVAELLPAVRPRVIRKIRHVPIPMAEPDRGPRIARSIAKRELGVVEGRVLVAYLPGAHQEDCSRRFADGGDRFDILLVERSAEVSGIAATRDGWVYSGRPDDETYGRILDACDVVVLSDPRALASLTLHAAVSRRRAVVSPDCPAVAELAQLGGAAIIRGPLTADGVAAALLELRGLLDSDDTTPFEQFEAAHSGTVVAGRLADVYGIRR